MLFGDVTPACNQAPAILENTMKQTTCACAVLIVLLSASGVQAQQNPANPAAADKTEAAAPKPVKAQTLCPVMKSPIDKSKFVDFEGKRIYVCCNGCIAAVKKDPAKYVKLLEAQGITLDAAKPAEAPPAAQ